jgi:hypothetical protein
MERKRERTLRTPELDAKIEKLYRMGYSYNQVGRYLEVSNVVITAVIKEYNIPTRTQSETKALKRDLKPIDSVDLD